MSHAFTHRNGKAFRYYRCVHAIKNGKGACPTGSVPAIKIEDVVVEQIKRIGADPALCEEMFRQVQLQVSTECRALKAEAKRLGRERTTASHEVDRLTSAVVRADGPAADALITTLAQSQERLTTLDRRRREIDQRQEALEAQDVDPAAVRHALAQFTAVWDVLLAPERERVVRLLIERIDYAGTTGELKITFSATGARLAADVASAEATS